EAKLTVADIRRLRAVLNIGDSADPNLLEVYQLDPAQLEAIGRLAETPFRPAPIFNQLVSWHANRETPCLIHTGFELPLMLEGRKPLAVFCDSYPAEWLDEVMSRFRPYVEAGRFVANDTETTFDGPSSKPDELSSPILRRLLFALPEEAWRIDAYLAL